MVDCFRKKKFIFYAFNPNDCEVLLTALTGLKSAQFAGFFFKGIKNSFFFVSILIYF